MGLLASGALLEDLHVITFLRRACLDFCMSVLPVRPEHGCSGPQLRARPYQAGLLLRCTSATRLVKRCGPCLMALLPSMTLSDCCLTQSVVTLAAGKSKVGKARWVKVDPKRKRDEDMNALRAARLRQRSVKHVRCLQHSLSGICCWAGAQLVSSVAVLSSK